MVVRASLKQERPGPRLMLFACPAGVARMSAAISRVLLFNSRMSLRSCGLRAANGAGDLPDVNRLSGRWSPDERSDIRGSFVQFPHVASLMRATRSNAAGDLADVIRLSGRCSPDERSDIRGSFV